MDLARAHSETGRGLYAQGRWDEALREFEAGYALVPKNQFLINIGQCQRHLGKLREARASFLAYRDRVPASDPELPEVDALVRELDAAIAQLPSEAPVTPPPVATTPVAVPPAAIAATPAHRRSRAARYAWIAPVAAVAVAGIVIGVYFGVHHGCDATLGCSDLR
jgi:hypothetical protein